MYRRAHAIVGLLYGDVMKVTGWMLNRVSLAEEWQEPLMLLGYMFLVAQQFSHLRRSCWPWYDAIQSRRTPKNG